MKASIVLCILGSFKIKLVRCLILLVLNLRDGMNFRVCPKSVNKLNAYLHLLHHYTLGAV